MKLDRLSFLLTSFAVVFIGALYLPELEATGAQVKSWPLQPTRKMLENYLYEVKFYHWGFMPCLSKGIFEQPGEQIILRQAAIGDLNGDGLIDAAVGLEEHNEGQKTPNVIKILLNNGERLVDVGTADQGMYCRANNLHIANGKVLATLSCFGDSGLKREPIEIRVLPRPFMLARTFQIDGTSGLKLGDRAKYCIDFAAQVKKVWEENKAQDLKECKERPQWDSFFDGNKHLHWSPANYATKPVVIGLNDPDTHLKTSSGDAVYDSIAYGAIDVIRRETPVPSQFIDTDLPLECTMVGDSVTCRDLAPPLKPIDLNFLNGKDQTGVSGSRSAVAELVNAACKHPERPWYKVFARGHLQLDEGTKLDCPRKMAADLDGDGRPDFVAHLRISKTDGTNAPPSIKNVIVPFRYDHGYLKLLPQQCFYLERASFANSGDDLIADIEVTKLYCRSKEIIVVYTGKTIKPPVNGSDNRVKSGEAAELGPTATFATEIDLTTHVVAEEFHSGKIFPPIEDLLTHL